MLDVRDGRAVGARDSSSFPHALSLRHHFMKSHEPSTRQPCVFGWLK
jgi:hypothetical protein